MDGWGALKMLQNRQEGNKQRKKTLKNIRDQKLKSNFETKRKLRFPKASPNIIKQIRENRKKEQRKEIILQYIFICIFVIILLYYSYYLGFFKRYNKPQTKLIYVYDYIL